MAFLPVTHLSRTLQDKASRRKGNIGFHRVRVSRFNSCCHALASVPASDAKGRLAVRACIGKAKRPCRSWRRSPPSPPARPEADSERRLTIGVPPAQAPSAARKTNAAAGTALTMAPCGARNAVSGGAASPSENASADANAAWDRFGLGALVQASSSRAWASSASLAMS